MQDIYNEETSKAVELKDKFGRTHFKITMTDYDNENYQNSDAIRTIDNYYKVKVYSYCFGDAVENPIVLIEEVYLTLSDANIAFDKYVRQYRILLNAETKGWQDITVYKDKIDYKIIDPDCCRNCKWAKRVVPQSCPATISPHKARYACMCPDVRGDVSDFEMRDPGNHDNYHGYCDSRTHKETDLAPYTREDGICKYHRRPEARD